MSKANGNAAPLRDHHPHERESATDRHLTQVYFSPGGSTARVAMELASSIAQSAETIDLLKEKQLVERSFGPKELVIVAMPVFSGRIPAICAEKLKKFKGENAYAIAVAVYGNRDYEDALLELVDLLDTRRFTVIAAAAFIARHSIFPEVARERPDLSDIERLRGFAGRCSEKLDSPAGAAVNRGTLKGNRPYHEAKPLPIRPSADSRCDACGICSKICPVDAIDAANTREPDREKCISCTACIYACPQNARSFRGIQYKLGKKLFQQRCRIRKKPEFFY